MGAVLGAVLSYVSTWWSGTGCSSSQTCKFRTLETGRHLDPARKAAKAMGLELTTGMDFTLLWSYRTPWDSTLFKSRMIEAKVSGKTIVFNHLPGTLSLASKAHLPAFARRAGLHGALPTTLLLPEDQNAIERAMSSEGLTDHNGLPKWIVKSKQHRGIRALTNATATALKGMGPAMIQRRVEPLLLRNFRRAFDVGLYVLVTSVRPLRVYVHDLALVRFCEAIFPTSAQGFQNEKSYVISHYSPIWTLPHFHESLRICNGSAACALRAELAADGYNADAIWRRMHVTTLKLLSQLVPHVIMNMLRLKLQDDSIFELFRFDYLIDKYGSPILTEVNVSPNIVAAHPQDAHVKSTLLHDVLHLVMQRLPNCATPSLICNTPCCSRTGQRHGAHSIATMSDSSPFAVQSKSRLRSPISKPTDEARFSRGFRLLADT